MATIFDYFRKIYPSGLPGPFSYIPWNLIEKLTTHWIQTGDNQYEGLINILSVIGQNRGKKNVWIPSEDIQVLRSFCQSKYAFDINDLELNTEETNTLNLLFAKFIDPNANGPKYRRKRACYVTQLKSVREQVFKRDGYKCRYCGDKGQLTVDHIIPVNLGGKDEFDNFQTLCKKCNSAKSDKRMLNASKIHSNRKMDARQVVQGAQCSR